MTIAAQVQNSVDEKEKEAIGIATPYIPVEIHLAQRRGGPIRLWETGVRLESKHINGLCGPKTYARGLLPKTLLKNRHLLIAQ